MGIRKRIILLGATGSIGKSTVDVVATHSDEFRIVAVSALRNRVKCEEIAAKFGAKAYLGEDGALRAVEENEADICLVATVGTSGIAPTLAAIEKKMDIALATKEVMVMAGEIVTRRARENGVKFLPVDSEHSAIFQALSGNDISEVDRLILTASGGPFLNGPEDLSSVTPEEALNHPRWKMGAKVTIDSSTMVNKAFEVLEARWLFDIPVERIDVVVHPESIVHSLVTYKDGATMAQLSPPDMRVAIQYALSAPRRLEAEREKLDLAQLGALTFKACDTKRFPALEIVKAALNRGGGATAVFAAADEWAVQAFLDGKIKYTGIVEAIRRALDNAPDFPCDKIEDVFAAAKWTIDFLENN